MQRKGWLPERVDRGEGGELPGRQTVPIHRGHSEQQAGGCPVPGDIQRETEASAPPYM